MENPKFNFQDPFFFNYNVSLFDEVEVLDLIIRNSESHKLFTSYLSLILRGTV